MASSTQNARPARLHRVRLLTVGGGPFLAPAERLAVEPVEPAALFARLARLAAEDTQADSVVVLVRAGEAARLGPLSDLGRRGGPLVTAIYLAGPADPTCGERHGLTALRAGSDQLVITADPLYPVEMVAALTQ